MYIVRLVSEVWGTNEYRYETLEDALAGIVRIYHHAELMQDNTERIVGLVINPQKED